MSQERWIAVLFCWLFALLRLLTVESLFAGDWPQWRGPDRNGISGETGLSLSWSGEGPAKVWTAPLGDGYSALAINGGRAYTMFSTGEDEFVVSLDAATGKEIWRTRIDTTFINDQGNGPRGTPTVDGNVIYALGAQAMLVALNSQDGKKIWEKDLKKDLQGKVPTWGVSSSPLIEKDLLIIPVGGSENNAVVAFNKKSGAVVWKSQTDVPGYSSPIAITMHGTRQILAFSGTMLLSLTPADGKLLWKYPWQTEYFVNAATPIFIPENRIFISTGYDSGAAMLKVTNQQGRWNVEELWLSKGMKNHFNSSVFQNGYIYGFDNAVLKCVDANTGEEKWKKSGFGKGSLILAEKHLIVLSERGQLVLVEADPAEYREKATAQVLQGKCWTQPALASGKLFLRNQKEAICLDLRKKA